MNEIQKALDEIKKRQEWCKEQYWKALDGDIAGIEPKRAANFSRIAAAYEYSHAIVAKAVGMHSDWMDAVCQEDQPATAEQQARDLLERMGIENAQSLSSGDLVELANLITKATHIQSDQE